MLRNISTERQDQEIRYRLAMLREEARSGATEMTGKTRRESYIDPETGHIEQGRIVGRYGGGLSSLYPELSYSGLTPKQAVMAIGRGKGKRWKRLYRAAKREVVREHGKAYSRGRLVIAPHKGYAYCSRCRERHSKGEHRFHGKGSFYATHPLAFGPMRSNPRIKPGWTYSKIIGSYYEFPRWAAYPEDRAQFSGDTFIARADYVADGGKRASFTAPWGPIGWMDLDLGRKVKRNPGRAGRRSGYARMRRRVVPRRKSRAGARFVGMRPNPARVKIYERLGKVYAQKGPGHKCDRACARAGHWYYHVFSSKPKMYGLANGDVLISSR